MIFSREALLWAFIYYGSFGACSENVLVQEGVSPDDSKSPTRSQPRYNDPLAQTFKRRDGDSFTLSVPDTPQVPPSPATGTPTFSYERPWLNTTSSTWSGQSHNQSRSSTTLGNSSTSSSTPCITLGPTDAVTIWDILPNTETITITTLANLTLAITAVPDFTPPNYCPTESTSDSVAKTTYESTTGTSITVAESSVPTVRPTTTITTNKNPATSLVAAPTDGYPGVNPTKSAVVNPGATTTPVNWGPLVATPGSGGGNLIQISTSDSNPPGPTTTNQPKVNPPSPSDAGGSGTSISGGAGASNPAAKNPVGPTTTSPPSAGSGYGDGSGGTSSLPSNNLPANGGTSLGGEGEGSGSGVITTIGTVPVSVGPTQVIIGGPGGQTVAVPQAISGGSSLGSGGSSTPTGNSISGGASGGTPVVVTQDGQVFTVNPSQVLAGSTTLEIPAINTGGILASSASPLSATPSTINGVPVQLSPSCAIVDGETYSIGAGAPETTVVANKQTISIGPGGLGFASTTVAPPPALASNFVIMNPTIFSVVGSSIAVIKGTTFTYGPGIAAETDVLDGETITIGPNGVFYDSTTLGGTAHATGTQLGVAGGVSITEVGSTLAVISSITFTVGPGATPSTTAINDHTIIVGSNGLGVDGTTISSPFNPTTQTVTAGGITFSEIGSSIAVIGGTSYTVGPGAEPETKTYNGRTISIGASGLGFATTTVPPLSSTPEATATTSAHTTGKKKNGAGTLKRVYGIVGACIAICIGFAI
ncbi:hypothetical protein LHYA1_G003390 [Lachnellula hyalina]|uniref:Cell agglutination protein n=1 Tax=Lachnellula hyalina TaxID=1316788 RepID=A0A8H8R2M3_9HELO|nr:uncharacterized protein LHYA1_G003390 [Lachnellula hyalina]TVY27284.1 hypothetical protein LHYA1_G003390 [Lachnellula hyalina]